MTRHLYFPIIAAVLMMVSACAKAPDNTVQGYVEGEFVYVASPLAGQVITLDVARGDQVKVGDPLFSLEHTFESAARAEAERRLAQSLAMLEDARKGKRPTEIQSAQAQLAQAKAALAFAEKELVRMKGLIGSGAISQQDYDDKLSQRDQTEQRVAQLAADLKTSNLPQREDQIAAAQADVHARQAALDQAIWNENQKHQDSPRAGLVFDTMYRPGEWVPAGHPIISLLPPENIKVRAFVPQQKVSGLHPGDSLSVHVDGIATPLTGKISFISPQSEYTPPVIYSQQSRDKLVFMIELTFDPQTAVTLHPGQPVDVIINP